MSRCRPTPTKSGRNICTGRKPGKPWSVQTGLPRNLITQKPYRGINVFLLMAMNYESPNWLTLRQANAMGGQIKPGEKSCPVVFWKPMQVKDKESGEDRKIPFLRLYHVFNVTQCTGLKNLPPADDTAFIQTLPAELVANMPQRPVIKHGMAMASYSPVSDVVNMPDGARFKGHQLLTIGTMDTILVHPREVFRCAIIAAAASVVVIHNHPSGESTPSEADIKVTRDLIRAGQLLKIELIDHVVIGNQNHSSLRSLGYFF